MPSDALHVVDYDPDSWNRLLMERSLQIHEAAESVGRDGEDVILSDAGYAALVESCDRDYAAWSDGRPVPSFHVLPSGDIGIETPEGFSLADLAAMPIAELPPSLPILGVEGVVFEGHATLFAAAAKAGKTTVLLMSVADWVKAGHRVLILTEEPVRNWQYAIQRFNPETPTDVWVIECRGKSPKDVLAAAIERPEYDVVVVDTARHLLRVDDENDASIVTKGMAPWCDLARDGRSVIVFHHENKSVGVSGSTAWESLPDRIVHMTKIGGEDSAKRKVFSRGRIADDKTFDWELVDGKAVVNKFVRKSRDDEMRDRRGRILEKLTGEPVSTKTLLLLLGDKVTDDTLRNDLETMAVAGQVTAHEMPRGARWWSK